MPWDLMDGCGTSAAVAGMVCELLGKRSSVALAAG